MPATHRLLAAACTLGLAAVLAAPVAAAGAPADRERRPAAVTLRGHGYGHGHGMSQYGAEGAARQGRSTNRILSFYYPGTEQSRAGGRLRVLLSEADGDEVVVRTRSRLSVRTDRRSWAVPDNGAGRWRLVADGRSRTRVQFRRDGWRTWRTTRGDAAFDADGRPLSMVGAGGAAYRGRLMLARPKSGTTRRDVVNDLSLEDYLRGVVPLEMPASWSPAAVRSQAIAARSYAAYGRSHPAAGHYDLCDTSSCQVYGGVRVEQSGSDAAIQDTARRIRSYRGEPAFTQFSTSSGGWTARGSVPYLQARRDRFDGWSGNPVHSWKARVSAGTIERAYPSIGSFSRLTVLRRDGNGQWGGRVLRLKVVGSKGATKTTGEEFRYAVGLRSSWFTT